MAEGPPERPGRTPLSHLVVPWPASDQAYKGRGGGAAKPIKAIGDRQSHAARLSGELESARDAARAKLAEVSPDVVADGFALSVESWSDEPGYKLAVQSLDTSGAKLLSVTPGTDQSPERAVVWLPFGAVGAFFTKIEQFATETTSRGNPRNQAARGQHRRPAPHSAARPVAGTRASSQTPTRSAGGRCGWRVSHRRLPPGEAKRATLDSSRLVSWPAAPARSCARSLPNGPGKWCPDCSPSRTT